MIKEQVKGRVEETKGKVKEVAGKVVGNKAMEQEGASQKNAGKTQAVAGDDKKSVKSPSTPKAQHATALLRADHKIVSDLFDEYEKTNVKSKKKSLVSQICADLTIHAQIEEEIFYPAVKAALKDKELVPEAIVEHATLKDLIAEVEGVEPDGETFDAKIKVLSEYVKHHVKEEQNEMFPRLKDSNLDMMELGAQIASRKEELVAERARRA
ncbi:hemerythrin domain-containing protein [Thiocapsa sp.]|uniref:hemerythrin domain-containing protein n=1 Tax=Thiocapsa sp. TaxID=2024551 RepID=UPI003594042F